ncbi:MAG TPA: DUF5719 family protein [Acidimicrobiia bacterium]|nr:DUF5719 family protein [Acidimicrobiia bacterium]
MSRWPTLALLAALLAGAYLMPAPDPEPQPLAGVIIDRPGLESPADASIWYCPWAQASAERDSLFAVASMAPATAEFTFPVAIPGEDPDTAELETTGPGAATLSLSGIAQRGDSPAYIEFDDGPSAATVTVVGDVLTADSCVASGPDEWFFVGGSTRTGETLRLRLFNPFPEVAKVTIAGFSEIGVEALGQLRSVSVNPRSWRDVDFEELLRQRESLVISVRSDDGLVVPAMAFGNESDRAWWSGTGLASEWEFPVARHLGVEDATLVIANPGLSQVDVVVDVFTRTGAQPGAFTVSVGPEAPARIDLSTIAEAVIGARVTSTSPVAAAVVATGETGTAVTSGVPVERTWLLPGLGTTGADEAYLWLLNSGDEAVTVTIGVLTGVETINTKEVLEPGTIRRIQVDDPDALGYVVFAADPFSAAWSLTGSAGTAFSAGIPVPEE